MAEGQLLREAHQLLPLGRLLRKPLGDPLPQGFQALELVGEAAEWFNGFAPPLDTDGGFHLEQTLVFFDTYLDEVREVLASEPAAHVSSGPWSESADTDSEQNFSAIAMLIDGRLVIQLKRIGQNGLYHQAVFQKAREYSLNYERLVKDRVQTIPGVARADVYGNRFAMRVWSN